MRLLPCLTVLLLLACSSSASDGTISAYERFQRMSADERSGFLKGSLDMLVYDFAVKRQTGRGTCANEWFFGQTGLDDIYNAIDKNREYPLSYILSELVKMNCPEDQYPSATATQNSPENKQ